MFVLFDALPLQAAPDSPAARRAAALLAGLRAARPGWHVPLLVRGDLPTPKLTPGPAHAFTPPLPDAPATRGVNELYFADWITALGPNAVVHLDTPVIPGLSPRYTHPAPRVVRDAADVTGLLAALEAPPREASPRESPPRKPRLAWASPAPPAETGVADYALEVAVALSERFELEWVTDPRGPAPTADVTSRFRVVPANAFDARHAAAPFDLPVYHLGNNHFHTYLLPLMRRHPGLVVAHDTHTGGLFRRSHEAGVWPAGYAEEVEHNGDWLLGAWVTHKLVHEHVAPTYCGFNRRPLDGAAGVLVHSAHGWREVRKVSDAPACVVPHIAVPPKLGTRAEERRRLGLPADRFIVTTLGIVSEAKRTGVLVRAAAMLPPDLRDNVLVLAVGPCEPEMRDKLTKLADDSGVLDRLEFRGRVPLDDFPAYAYAADVCVQLRFPCNGETSGALTRAMAAGAACVVSDTGAMAEIPNAVAPKVRTPARDADDLAAVLVRLARDPAERDRLAAAAKAYISATHRPETAVAGYAAAVAGAVAHRDANDGRWRVLAANALADLPHVPDGLIEEWARLRAAAVTPDCHSRRKRAG